MQKPSKGFLAEVASFLGEIQRAELARGVEQASRKLHGEPLAGCLRTGPQRRTHPP